MEKVFIDSDNLGLVRMTMDVCNATESEAVNILIEIGLINILTYPANTVRVNNAIERVRNFREWVARIKSVWV